MPSRAARLGEAAESDADANKLTDVLTAEDNEDDDVVMGSATNAEWPGLQNRAILEVLVKSLSLRSGGSLIRENSARGSSVYDFALHAPLLPLGQPWTAHSA